MSYGGPVPALNFIPGSSLSSWSFGEAHLGNTERGSRLFKGAARNGTSRKNFHRRPFLYEARQTFRSELTSAATASSAAEVPASRPSTVAVSRPLPDRYPAAREPETPTAAPPAANKFGKTPPIFLCTRELASIAKPPWV